MSAAVSRRLPFVVVSLAASLPTHRLRRLCFLAPASIASLKPFAFASAGFRKSAVASFCSDLHVFSESSQPLAPEEPSKQVFVNYDSDCFYGHSGALKSGLYLVGTPIGNLEDITYRALRVLRSADVILSEDTRHSGKLLQYYHIKTPLMSYHKFNESHRESTVLQRLQQGQIVALISDAGMPGISDPGTDLARLCIEANILVVPIPGPSAVLAALSASGLPTDEFTFVGFLPKHAGSRKGRLLLSANQTATQIFFVPPHKLQLFLEETSLIFGDSRKCVIAREMTKIYEEFWHGTLGDAKKVYSDRQPKGEITLLIEGKANVTHETPTESEVEDELREMISSGHSISMAVKLVAEVMSMKRKEVYSIALRKFRKQRAEDDH